MFKMHRGFLFYLLNCPNKPFYFVTTVCTVLLLTPNFLAVLRTVEWVSEMYCPNNTLRSSTLLVSFPLFRFIPMTTLFR